jgi:hypothetical protein
VVAEPVTGLITAAIVTKAAGPGSSDADARQVMLATEEAFTMPASMSGRANFSPRCGRCIVKDNCTTAAGGRIVMIDEGALLRRAHRAQASTPAFTTVYRQTRPMAERAIAWMTRHMRRMPYRGVVKNNAAWQVRAAAINLKRLTTMGLTRHNGTRDLPATA